MQVFVDAWFDSLRRARVGIYIGVTGSHGVWQQGLGESRGGLLNEIWGNTVCELHVSGREQTKLLRASEERNIDEVRCHS